MFIPRSYYTEAGYSPSEASQYGYGSVVPSPRLAIAAQLKGLKNISKATESPISSENFQRFLLMQNNPEALFFGNASLPKTPLGDMTSFLS